MPSCPATMVLASPKRGADLIVGAAAGNDLPGTGVRRTLTTGIVARAEAVEIWRTGIGDLPNGTTGVDTKRCTIIGGAGVRGVVAIAVHTGAVRYETGGVAM
mmetsp:Transcript_101033/g.263913  ORF Transcript_101033/g.263913 Transcript_101033/m.263913 type:complete len:102 (-) Transcript_101033:1276-1581(-)